MIKYICLISELLYTNNVWEIIEGDLYIIEYVNKHLYYLYDNNENYLGQIWGTISDNFITLAEWREKQINSILDETISEN